MNLTTREKKILSPVWSLGWIITLRWAFWTKDSERQARYLPARDLSLIPSRFWSLIRGTRYLIGAVGKGGAEHLTMEPKFPPKTHLLDFRVMIQVIGALPHDF